MLMVVFGAGASYDSSPAYPALAINPRGDRLSLASQLFDTRTDFVHVLRQFPQCHPIVPYLQNHNRSLTIEQELQRLQAEAPFYSQRHRQLAAIRYYLHLIIWACEDRWHENVTHGITNHITLLDQIQRWRRPEEPVCLVTFNYDRMIEAALSKVGIRIQNLSDYIASDSYKLIKLHGSVNWAREVDTTIENLSEMNAWQVASALIDCADQIALSQRYCIVTDTPIGKSINDVPLFPALAMPVEAKSEFECPTEHVEMLCSLIPNVDKLLMIGWRAAEQPFLQLLAENLERPVQGLVVAASPDDAQNTIENVKQADIKGDFWNVRGGFTEFVVNREGDEFLQQ